MIEPPNNNDNTPEMTTEVIHEGNINVSLPETFQTPIKQTKSNTLDGSTISTNLK